MARAFPITRGIESPSSASRESSGSGGVMPALRKVARTITEGTEVVGALTGVAKSKPTSGGGWLPWVGMAVAGLSAALGKLQGLAEPMLKASVERERIKAEKQVRFAEITNERLGGRRQEAASEPDSESESESEKVMVCRVDDPRDCVEVEVERKKSSGSLATAARGRPRSAQCRRQKDGSLVCKVQGRVYREPTRH